MSNRNVQHVRRHGILDPKGLLTPGSVLSAILIGGIVVLLAGQSAYTQVGQEANKVLVGATAFGDWHNDAPGVRRLITAQDLPEIGKEEPSFAEVVPMPVGARPRVPEGFSAELVASGLAQPQGHPCCAKWGPFRSEQLGERGTRVSDSVWFLQADYQ